MLASMPAHAYALLAAGWLLWVVPFTWARPGAKSAEVVDRRARWGVALQGLAYSVLWWNDFWLRDPGVGRTALSILFFLLAAVLSWSSVRSLGRQWRVDAGLNADHELVRSGPYRLIRHPIYTSMLCLLFATGLLVAPPAALLFSTLLFLIGTEVRVRIEERLLVARFGEQFLDYERRVAAYVPRLR
jgi:protein-S-isoprenylcysteine O-methyltransferase Ste14